MRKWILLFITLLVMACLKESSIPDMTLNDYFKNVKTLNYEKSLYVVALMKDSTLAKEFESLNKLLENGVQGNEMDLEIKTKDQIPNSLLGCIIMLKQGYYELYYNPNKLLAYRNFYDALEISRKLENLSLRKFCLRSILEYYRAEIARNDKNYSIYLEELQQLRSDKFDHIWEVVYQLIFKTAYVMELDADYYALIDQLSDLAKELEDGHPMLSQIFFEEALSHELSDRWEEARIFYQKAFENSQLYSNQSYIGFSSTIKLSEYYRQNNELDSAFLKLKEIACCLNPNDTLKDQFYISHYKSIYLKDIDECCMAYDELLKSTDVGYLLDFRTNNLEIARLQVELDTKKKELQNNNFRIQITGLIVTLVIGIVFSFLVFQNNTKKRILAEQQQLIEKQKVEALLKEQELVSIDAMITGQEKERSKVANELHDDLGSLMATVKLHFENVKVDQKDPAMKNAQDLLEKAYQKIRGMAHAKNSGVMAKQGLLPAIKKMANTINKTNALKVTVADFGLAERMENSLELTIFRIIQELVTNIIKHAEATEASIQFTQHEAKLNIIVEDNGKGFDMSTVQRDKKGMGLGTIEKRIEHLEGDFTVDSVIDKGTSILIDIPV